MARRGARVGVTFDLSDVRGRLGLLTEDKLKADPELKRHLLGVAMRVKNTVANAAKGAMKSDPREAWRAVRVGVWTRNGIGGFVAILDDKKTEASTDAKYARRGGRRARSARTNQVDSYVGRSRAFILRFLNDGTTERTTKYGARGRLRRRNFFAPAANPAVKKASDELQDLLRDTVNKRFNNG